MKLLTIDLVSNLEYEFLTAEISCAGQLLCRIDKERGDDLDIEFFFDFRKIDVDVNFKFSLTKFLGVLEEASAAIRVA